MLVLAVAIGGGLVSQGDSESGDLSLPERVGTKTSVGNMQYEVSEGSEITFTVGEQLARLPLPNDAVIRTSALSGQLNFDGQPSVVEVDLWTLSSDQDFRDRYIRGRMFRDSQVAVFTVEDVTSLPDEFFSGETFTRRVTGLLSINGIDAPLTFDLEVRNDGDVLNILGNASFTWDQLQIPVPTARGVVSIEDEVSVQLLLVAEPV